eukprot:scaffold14391_cov73-Skeletonema_dohrnii-CCMP3373.AAC.1
MIWGGNSAPPPPSSSTPDSPVASAVKTFEANSPNRAAAGGGGGVTVVRGGSGKSPPRNSVAPLPSSSSMSPSRPTPFYKRTAPPPIVTTPNRPTSTKTAAITSTMPTPPSRVGVRQKRGVSPSPALPMSGGNVGGGINNKPATPLQQRRGNLNIAPLVTNFEGEMKQKESDVVVRTILHHQKQPQPHLPPSSSSNNAPPPSSSPPQSSQQQQQGITTITAFKRPNHKVGIIFTRQSSSSPDVAIIARILPESIFAQHDEAERRDQALRVAALKKQGLTTTNMSPLAVKAATRGLEGSEVIAVNGVPVRNPRHAAEMVAKAVEEVRLTICKMAVDNTNGSGGMKKKGGVVGVAPSGGVVSPRSSPVFSPKVPELTDDDNSPQSRQEEEEGRPNSQYHQLSNNLAQSRSIDEESTFSVRTEGPDQQQQQQVDRKGMNSMADELSAVTETVDDEPLQKKKEPMFVVKRGSPKKQQQQQNGRGGDDTAAAAAAAAAKKSKEIADMRRKVAQAMLMSQEMVHDPIDDGNNHDIDSEDEDWAAPQQVKKSPVFTKKKVIAPPPPPPQSPKSPSMDLAERRRQAALDMYNSQEMVGDNVDDAALGMTDVVGMNKETIGGGGGVLPPPMPMKDMDRVNSFGTSSVASKARTDITTESMATQQMGSTSPKVVASSLSGEKEVFQFEDDDGENERKASSAVKSPVRQESRRVEREPEEVAAAASAVAAGAMQELQRQRGAAAKKDNAAVTRSAAAPPSPARDSVTDSPGRKGLFGKIKSQKKMFGGVKKMLKPQKFKKSKAVDRGIPLEDSHSNEEGRVDTIETNTARRA